MKVFDIQRDGTGEEVPVGLVVDRWHLRLLGWHFATAYRYDLVLPARDHTTQRWICVSPFDHFGFGVALPVAVSKWLGIDRDYNTSAAPGPIAEGDTIVIGDAKLEVVACDHDHGLYELRDPDAAHLDGHPAIVFAASQLQQYLPS